MLVRGIQSSREFYMIKRFIVFKSLYTFPPKTKKVHTRASLYVDSRARGAFSRNVTESIWELETKAIVIRVVIAYLLMLVSHLKITDGIFFQNYVLVCVLFLFYHSTAYLKGVRRYVHWIHEMRVVDGTWMSISSRL